MPEPTPASIFENSVRDGPMTLRAHVYNELREAIVSGRYRPGDRLNESRLARELNISRIPIREALQRLQEQGLVMNRQRRGMFVTELPEADVQRITSLRVVLEAEALRLCRANMTRTLAAQLTALVEKMETWQGSNEIDAAAIDLEFHRAIWNAAGNPVLCRALNSLSTVLFAHTALRKVGQEGLHWRLSHRELLDLVLGRSDVPAETAVIDHLQMHCKDPGRFSSFRPTPPPASRN